MTISIQKISKHSGIMLLLLKSLSAYSAQQQADVIFKNGHIITMDKNDTVASNMAIRKNKILAVNIDDANIEKLIHSRKTKIIDLKGATIIPGFVGAHEHPSIQLFYSSGIDLSGFTHKNNADVWNVLKTRLSILDKNNKGKKNKEWFFGVGLDLILTPDLQPPTKQQLDAMTPNGTPVVLISQTLHSAWVNSAALKAANIADGADGTKDPVPGQSYYERDSNKILTGYIVELSALKPIFSQLVKSRFSNKFALVKQYRDVLKYYQKYGFTSVASMGVNIPPLLIKIGIMIDQLKNGQPPVRQIIYLSEPELDKPGLITKSPLSPSHFGEFLYLRGVKLWYDGSPYTGQMYTSNNHPYLLSDLQKKLGIKAGSHGNPAMTPETLKQKIEKYTKLGWQIAIHTQGDQATQEVCTALSQLQIKPAMPIRVEHLLLTPSFNANGKIEKFCSRQDIPMTTSFHINHIYYYGDALVNSLIGKQAMETSLQIKTAFDLNLTPSLHADSPMFPPAPFSLMQTAITRKTMSGKYVIDAEQKITVHQAMQAMTINAAYQVGLDKHAGSLEVGKWADFLIIDKNPYDYDKTPFDLNTIQIKAIYLGGKKQL